MKCRNVSMYDRDKLRNYLTDFDEISKLDVIMANLNYRIDIIEIIEQHAMGQGEDGVKAINKIDYPFIHYHLGLISINNARSGKNYETVYNIYQWEMELTAKERAEMKKHMKKVLSIKEKPYDGLRARTIVLLTHKSGGVEAFMNLKHLYYGILRSYRFSAWKYCNLLHKMMRFGDMKILKALQSADEQKKLNDLADYWSEQNGAIDACISKYLRFLISKAQFHENFTFFNGALEAEITKQWDLNLCYQLCTDIFDYLDNLLSLQHSIFFGLTLQQISIATIETQCRLQPLINIAAECSILYDQALDAMGVVCAKLPADDVAGLRNRFYELYQLLHGFYSALQQVKIILKMEYVPELSSSVPDFGGSGLRASEVAAVSSMSEKEPTAPPEWELE